MPLSDDRLVSRVRAGGWLSPEQVREAREEARRTGRPLFDVVKAKRWLDDAYLALLEAEAATTPAPDMTGVTLTPASAAELGIAPSSSPTVLGVATPDPNARTLTPPTVNEADKATTVPLSRSTPATSPVRPSGTPPALAHYDLVREIGRGGMGTVYEATDRSLGRRVALKILTLEGRHGAVERFQREARAAARLQHPNILQVYEVGEEAGRHFIAIEFVDGEPLESKIRRYHASPPQGALRDLVEALRQAALGLDFAHKEGVTHRDVKPSNILVDRGGRAMVADFGLARDDKPGSGSDIRLTVDGAILGTPGYLAPEQAFGKPLDARADIYSLGASLYEVLTGRLPFQGGTLAELLHRSTTQDPPPPSSTKGDVPAPLELVCLKALQRDPARRYATAGEFAEELGRWLRAEPVKARPESAIGTAVRNAKSDPIRLVGAVVLFVAALGVFGAVNKIWKKAFSKEKQAEATGDPKKSQELVQQGEATLRDAKAGVSRALASLSPGHPDRVKTMAAYATALGGAEAQFRAAVAADPSSATARLRHGHTLRLLGRPADARAALDESIRLADTPAARQERALVLYTEALSELWPPLIFCVEAVAPRSAPQLRADAQHLADLARADLGASEAAGASGPVLELLRCADNLTHQKPAWETRELRTLESDLGWDPDFQYVLALGALCGRMPHLDKDAFDVLFELQPDRPRTRLQRPLAHLDSDPVVAERMAAAALAVAPGDPRAILIRASALARTKKDPNCQEALALIEPLLATPFRDPARVVGAHAALHLYNLARLKELSLAAYLANKEDPVYQFQHGAVYYLAGNPLRDEGEKILEKFLKEHPLHPLKDEAKNILKRAR